MLTDLALAILHQLIIFALVASLTVELVLVHGAVTSARIGVLARIDRAYGGLALLLLVVGFARVFFGLKDASFYLANPVFRAKMGAFLIVALASIVPTMRIIAWARAGAGDPAFQAPADALQNVRGFMRLDAIVFLLIPVLAAMMARGVGV